MTSFSEHWKAHIPSGSEDGVRKDNKLWQRDLKLGIMIALSSMNHKKKIDKKTITIWYLKMKNQIANFHSRQVSGPSSQNFESQTNDDETQRNLAGGLDMT